MCRPWAQQQDAVDRQTTRTRACSVSTLTCLSLSLLEVRLASSSHGCASTSFAVSHS
jgi:hypothetical protein